MPHGQGGAGQARQFEGFCARAAFDGRPGPDAPLHRAFSGGAADLERGLGIRWKRAAGKEMLRAADCELHGAATRVDGRAHADSGSGITGRESDVHGRGVSERLREDQPGDDGIHAGEPGLQSMDGGRRHRLDEDRRGRLPARH